MTRGGDQTLPNGKVPGTSSWHSGLKCIVHSRGFFWEMTSEGFSITVFIVGSSFARVLSFRSVFQLLPGDCLRIPVSLRSLFEETHTFPT